MAELSGFDARTQKPMDSFDAIPAGEYNAIAVESEFKPTKAGTGKLLQFVFQIIDGEYKDRKLWARLNLVNPNSTAVDLAQRELGEFCRAVGVPTPRDSAELHNKPVTLKVGIEKRKDTGEDSNRIKGYLPIGTKAAAPAPAAPASAPATAPSTPPWRR
jgi:hypothetical protein